jgi:hypothetical protein
MKSTKVNVTLYDADFNNYVARGGVAYAFMAKEASAKKQIVGKNLSASEYAVAERTIRKLVASYGTETITSQQVADVAQVLSANPGMYANYTINEQAGADSYMAEATPLQWVKYPNLKDKAQAAPALAPAPAPAPTPTPTATEPPAPAPAPAPAPVAEAKRSKAFSFFNF